jgi:hypothetical protein
VPNANTGEVAVVDKNTERRARTTLRTTGQHVHIGTYVLVALDAQIGTPLSSGGG